MSSPIYVIVPSSTNMHWANLGVLLGVCSVVKNLPLTNSVVVGDIVVASGEYENDKKQRKDRKRCTGPDGSQQSDISANSNITTGRAATTGANELERVRVRNDRRLKPGPSNAKSNEQGRGR